MIVNVGKGVIRGKIEAVTALFGSTWYIGLSTDATSPTLTDTTITAEQTANGLARAAATMAHTTGTNTWTFSNTFTFTGSTSTNIQKVALFDAASGGNLITEDLVSSTVFSVSGDNCPFSISFSL